MCGKTTELIKRSHEEWLYILCANRTMARLIFEQAIDMELDIPFPLILDDLPLRGNITGVLVDEVELVLERMIGKNVDGISSSMTFRELPPLRKE